MTSMAPGAADLDRRLDALQRVSVAITRAPDLAAVLRVVTERAAALLRARSATIWLRSDETGSLAPAASALDDGVGLAHVGPGDGVIGAVAERRQGVVRAGDGTASALVAEPMLYRHRLLGVLVVEHPGATLRFTDHDAGVIRALAAQAAVAVENARLEEQSQRQQRETRNQLGRNERLRALGSMAAGVAHSFNNTLAAILIRAEILAMEPHSEKQRRHIDVIHTVAKDAAQTVRRIQEFARLRRARPFQLLVLDALVEDVLELTRTRWSTDAQMKGLAFDVRAERGGVPAVQGDPAEVRDALTNLVFNALDAMPVGGSLTLRTGVTAGRVFCEVRDSGTGMTDEVRERIFDPFYTTKNETGSGLGLSIVQGIMTRHGGEVTVETAPGQGSAFRLWFSAAERRR